MSEKIIGKAASPGYAIGKVFVFKKEDFTPMEVKIQDSDMELERFEKAVETCRDQLENIRQKVEKEVDSEKAAIFSAELLILEDPVLIDETEKIISEEKLDIKSALYRVIKKNEEEFSRIEDEYIKERVQDLKDVASRLIDICGGEKTALLSGGFKQILLAEELYPSQTAVLNKDEVIGIVTRRGGVNSHAAIIARALRIPAVVGAQGLDLNLARDTQMILDGIKGEIIVNPSSAEMKEYEELKDDYQKKEASRLAFADKLTVTKDGKRIILSVNANSHEEYRQIIKNNPDGVGLFRSEVFFIGRDAMPSEEEQQEIYLKLLEAANPEPVIIRLLDVGADKEIKYIKQKKEDNPALGLRGVRLLLSNKEILKAQLRAIVKANKYGNARIMLPMVSVVEEVKEARNIYNEVAAELKKEGMNFNADIPMGIMIETPVAAVISDKLAKVSDFFSLGTNDLVQYTLAADRVNEDLGGIYQALNPAIWRLIKTVVESANNAGIEISVCGEAASSFLCIPLFIGVGIKKLSVNPAGLLEVRENISRIDTSVAREVAQKILEFDTALEVELYLKKIFE